MTSRLLTHYGASKTAFFCCDLQTGFASKISNFKQAVFVANRFAALHSALPANTTKFIVTEQYPKALGKTVPEITIPADGLVFEKTKFSMLTDDVRNAISDVNQIVIFGIEAHVCVLQTIQDLLDTTSVERVAVARDGVGSQVLADESQATQLFQAWGPRCYVSTSESILFQLARDAKDPNFKVISSLAKQRFVSE